MIWIIMCYVIYGVIWGVACNSVVRNKGYYENWFWLGFFFGFIAFIVALTKSDCRGRQVPYQNTMAIKQNDSFTNKTSYGGKDTSDSWTCIKCKKVHPGYNGVCQCGTTKSSSIEEYRRIALEKFGIKEENNNNLMNQKQDSYSNEIERLEIIKKYKELLDMGVITEEEFAEKKALYMPKEEVVSVKTKEEAVSIKTKEEVVSAKNKEEEWCCTNCGATNKPEVLCCYYCGKVKEYN